MKNRILVIFLVIAAVLFAITACSSPKKDNGKENSPKIDDNAIVNGNTAIYELVRPETCSKELTAAVLNVRSHIETLTGVELSIKTDWSKEGKYDSSTKEILIGDTKYNESIEAKAELGDNKFSIVKKDSKIVIVAIDEQSVISAINYFLSSLISHDAEKGILMYNGTDFHYNEQNAINNLKINGVLFSEFKIICQKNDQESIAYAHTVQQNLKEKLSYTLSTADVNDAGANNVIFIFSNHPSYTPADYMNYNIHVEGGNLIVSTGGYYSLERLLMNFADTLFTGGIFDMEDGFSVSGNYFDAKTYDIPKDADVRMISANILAEYADWGSTIDVKYRTEIFAGNMNFYNPDVIGIQECSPYWLSFLQTEFKSNSPYKLLGKPSTNIFTYVVYNSERLEVLEFGYKDYSVKNNMRARGIAYGVFKDKESGKVFAFGSTHWNGGDNDDCRKQVDEAAKVLNDIKAKYKCTIYCTGDFNSNENTGVYKTFMELTAMEDTMYTTNNRTNNLPSWHELGKENFSVKSCDHIFASSGVRCVKFRTLVENSQIYASDHSWLCADIVLP